MREMPHHHYGQGREAQSPPLAGTDAAPQTESNPETNESLVDVFREMRAFLKEGLPNASAQDVKAAIDEGADDIVLEWMAESTKASTQVFREPAALILPLLTKGHGKEILALFETHILPNATTFSGSVIDTLKFFTLYGLEKETIALLYQQEDRIDIRNNAPLRYLLTICLQAGPQAEAEIFPLISRQIRRAGIFHENSLPLLQAMTPVTQILDTLAACGPVDYSRPEAIALLRTCAFRGEAASVLALWATVPPQKQCTEKSKHLLITCATRGQPAAVMQILTTSGMTSMDNPVVVEILVACAEAKAVDDVMHFISRHKEKIDLSNARLLNLLYTCIKAKKAEQVLDIVDARLVPGSGNVAGLRRLLEACAREGSATRVMQYVTANTTLFLPETRERLLAACARHGEAASLFADWQEQKNDRLTDEQVGSFLTACAAGGQSEQILASLSPAELIMIDSTRESSTILQACVEAGHGEQVMSMLESRAAALSIESPGITQALNALASRGFADRVFGLLKERNSIAAPDTWRLCALHGQQEQVLAWLTEKQLLHFDAPDILDVILACAREGLGEKIFQLFTHTSRYWEFPPHSADMLIANCLQGGLSYEAMVEMLEKNIQETVIEPREIAAATAAFEKSLKNKRKTFFHTLDEQTRLFTQPNRPKTRSIMNRFMKLLHDTFGMADPPQEAHASQKTFASALRATVEHMTTQELEFFSLTIGQYGMFSERTAQILDRYRAGRPVVTELKKTGSELRIFFGGTSADDSSPGQSTFVNDIPPAAAAVWQQVAETNIPVAPILSSRARPRQPNASKDVARVYSRYCGTSTGKLADIYESIPSPAIQQVLFTIASMRSGINHLLERAPINGKNVAIKHGHTHVNNFTVEYIDRSYLAAQKTQGENINTVPYSAPHWSFRLEDYLDEPARWQIVTRLIDWDKSKSLEVGTNEEEEASPHP